jgi:hypothetical protein
MVGILVVLEILHYLRKIIINNLQNMRIGRDVKV